MSGFFHINVINESNKGETMKIIAIVAGGPREYLANLEVEFILLIFII